MFLENPTKFFLIGEKTKYDDIVKFYGHSCLKTAIGFKIGEIVTEKLRRSEDGGDRCHSRKQLLRCNTIQDQVQIQAKKTYYSKIMGNMSKAS